MVQASRFKTECLVCFVCFVCLVGGLGCGVEVSDLRVRVVSFGFRSRV